MQSKTGVQGDSTDKQLLLTQSPPPGGPLVGEVAAGKIDPDMAKPEGGQNNIIPNAEKKGAEPKKVNKKMRTRRIIKMKHEHIQTDLYNYFLGIEKNDVTNKPNIFSETDLHFGDFVISFPNPDHPDAKEFSINFSEAERLFSKIFKSVSIDQQDKIYNKCVHRAFALAFNQLENCSMKFDKLDIPNFKTPKNGKNLVKKKKNTSTGPLDDLHVEYTAEKIGSNGGFLICEEDNWFRSRKETKVTNLT